LVARVEGVGDEIAPQRLVEGRARLVDECRVEREELKGARGFAPQVQVHLAGLSQAERPWRLHALAPVDARDRSAAARQRDAVVRLHAAKETGRLAHAKKSDAVAAGACLGRGEHP
jgi:hypothetical protein